MEPTDFTDMQGSGAVDIYPSEGDCEEFFLAERRGEEE